MKKAVASPIFRQMVTTLSGSLFSCIPAIFRMGAVYACWAVYVSPLSADRPANHKDASLAVARYPDEPAAWLGRWG